MFIIFDLDDTLIDTSSCITPVKLQRALQTMVDTGLALDNFDEALAFLLRLDKKASSAKSALEEFIEVNDIDPKYLPVALREVYQVFSEDIPIFPTEDAIEALSTLSFEHQMAIVTVGHKEHQLLKLKKAGIDSSLFCKILVLDQKNKKKHYQNLMQEMHLSPSQVVVCGDRVSIDLVPAKQLGFKTVHIKKGRGVNSFEAHSEVDFTISQISEINHILQGLKQQVNF